MSTLQDTRLHPDRIRTRLVTGIIALSALITIGLALLILAPTGHRTAVPTSGSVAPRAVLAARTPAPAGCFRDPATHALACADPAPVPIAVQAGYFRDPATHRLLRIPVVRKHHHRPGPKRPTGGAAV